MADLTFQQPIDTLNRPINYDPIFVSRDDLSGWSRYCVIGENLDMDTGGTETVWSQGGNYVFSSTAAINKLSSSSNTNTQTIEVLGLDSNWGIVTQNITLTGQTPVNLTTPLLRINRLVNRGTTDIIGIVYCYESLSVTSGVPTDLTKIRLTIVGDDNRTLMCVQSVPDGYTGYINLFYITAERAAGASGAAINMSLRSRTFGSVFITRQVLSLGTAEAFHVKQYTYPMKISAKTDIIVRCDSVTANNTRIASGFDFILTQNNLA